MISNVVAKRFPHPVQGIAGGCFLNVTLEGVPCMGSSGRRPWSSTE
jgi:hypothetical protein